MKAILIMVAALSLSGCMTLKLSDAVEGTYIDKRTELLGKPRPYLAVLFPVTVALDVVTAPVQIIWIGSQL